MNIRHFGAKRPKTGSSLSPTNSSIAPGRQTICCTTTPSIRACGCAARTRASSAAVSARTCSESGTNSVIGSTQGPVTSSNPIWQRAADWSTKAQGLVRVMKIRLFVFLQHGRHETIDISPVVSPRIASASACYRSALFEICDLRGERRLEAVTAAECLASFGSRCFPPSALP